MARIARELVAPLPFQCVSVRVCDCCTAVVGMSCASVDPAVAGTKLDVGRPLLAAAVVCCKAANGGGEATRLCSGKSGTTATASTLVFECRSYVDSKASVATSQQRTVPSLEEVTSVLPAGERRAHVTRPA
mmetsp:Transcript_3665/g.8048  ORF Transcript_3665/g.8048 Transcript_3665/m.8048 type:complete len:131 (-) Transcript_3665:792-1184(-)